jgi:hypothetical protein
VRPARIRLSRVACAVTAALVTAGLALAPSVAASSHGTQSADAKALIGQLKAREARLNAPGSYQASPIIDANGQAWLVLEGADAAIGTTGSATANTYPDATVTIDRWTSGGWTEQAEVRGWFGPIGGCCGISAASLTGSRDPDFALMGGGAADTNWLAIVSDVGGRWHAVPFDYGYSDTTVVNAYAMAHQRIETAVDASSSATGPTTLLWESYQDGAFRPSAPPGRSAPCSLSALQLAADPGEVAVLVFSKFACADGWAMAIGTGAGYGGQVVALFEQAGTKWGPIEIDNGASLGSDPGLYDLPLSLLRTLTAGFGPGVRPALATAPLIEHSTDEALDVNGVIAADGADWYVTENLTGSAAAPGADAEIYRWSGSAWVARGRVDNVPRSLNYFYALQGGWFEAVTVPGTNDPGFAMEASGSRSSATLTDAGGTWHAS